MEPEFTDEDIEGAWDRLSYNTHGDPPEGHEDDEPRPLTCQCQEHDHFHRGHCTQQIVHKDKGKKVNTGWFPKRKRPSLPGMHQSREILLICYRCSEASSP